MPPCSASARQSVAKRITVAPAGAGGMAGALALAAAAGVFGGGEQAARAASSASEAERREIIWEAPIAARSLSGAVHGANQKGLAQTSKRTAFGLPLTSPSHPSVAVWGGGLYRWPVERSETCPELAPADAVRSICPGRLRVPAWPANLSRPVPPSQNPV